MTTVRNVAGEAKSADFRSNLAVLQTVSTPSSLLEYGPLNREDRDLARLSSQTTISRWHMDKETIGLSRVQTFYHICVARSYH